MSTTPTRTPAPESPAGPGGPHPRSGWSLTRSALGLLREQAWLGALLGVIVISVVFVFLGRWQYHRHLAHAARNHLVNSNYGAAPVPLSELLPTVGTSPPSTLPAGLEWRQVRLDGTYLTQDTVLLRNRPQPSDGGSGDDSQTSQNTQNGYEIAIPFRTTDGTVLYVNRGWIPAGTSSAARPDSVPAAPAGVVQVIARLRPSEPVSTRKAPPGQTNRLNPGRLGEQLDGADRQHLVGAFGALVSESPAAADTPSLSGKPDSGLGINFAYAVQWVAFAITAYVLFGVALVREVRRRDLLG